MQETGIVKKLYKSRKNILKHMSFVGYNVEKYQDATISQVDVMYQHKQLDILLENDNGKKCYIKYHLGKSLRKSDINTYMDELFINPSGIEFDKNDDLLIVSNIAANDTIVEELKLIWSKYGYFIRVICIDNLQYNMFEHEYVPKHYLMTQKQQEEFLVKYNINSLKKIPEISRFDPAALCIGLRPGEICKIIRSSKTAVESEYYRVCIN